MTKINNSDSPPDEKTFSSTHTSNPKPIGGTSAVPGTSIYNIPKIVNYPSPTRNGWECPKCHRVWAPFVEGCSHCNNQLNLSQPGGFSPSTMGG